MSNLRAISKPRRSATGSTLRLLPLCVLALVSCLSASEPALIPEGVAKHSAIQKPPPTISPLARQMKVSGRVEVTVLIGESGAVDTAKVMSGNSLLAESVIIAVKNWKFQPFLQNGKPSLARTTLSFEFKQ